MIQRPMLKLIQRPATGLFALLALCAAAPASSGSTPGAPHSSAPAPSGPQESVVHGGIEFAKLSFEDAISRAERTKKILVIFWTGDNEVKNATLASTVFDDEGVQRWMGENAEGVFISALERKRDAKKNGISADVLPAIDILDVARGGRVERLRPDGTPTQFLAAVFGIGEAEMPTGEDAKEPFRWLAWANARFRESDDEAGADAVRGYEWCLTRADDERPGFRAKYLEFLLQRVAYCKQRTPRAAEVLYGDRIRIMEKMGATTAEETDIYELTRVDFWLRKELLTRDLFVQLGDGATRGDEYRKWLFPTVLPTLGRFQQYDEILDVVGDQHIAMFQSRIEALSDGGESEGAPGASPDAPAAGDAPKAGSAGDEQAEAAPEKPTAPAAGAGEKRIPTALDFAAADSRSDIIDQASWVYEALLSVGRGKDAKDLMLLVTEAFPVNKAFGLFMERALRVKVWAAAAEIGDLGMALLDARGQKRMQRLLGKIPKDMEGK